MKLALNSLPDCKMLHDRLTLGGEYEIQKVVGNGYVIETDDHEPIIVLQERFVRGKP